MSKRTYYSIASLLHAAGYILAFFGGGALMFVACCLDSEGEAAFYFLLKATAVGALLIAVGALLLRISSAMRERQSYGHIARSSRY